MEYKLVLSSSFKKDYKLIKKQGKDISLLDEIVPVLLSGKKLPAKYKDHELKGDWKGFRELHIQPDWLLIYTKNDTELILTLSRTGSHTELLKKQNFYWNSYE